MNTQKGFKSKNLTDVHRNTFAFFDVEPHLVGKKGFYFDKLGYFIINLVNNVNVTTFSTHQYS
jgi:hypothetical protein